MNIKLYLSLFERKSFVTVIVISLLVWLFLILKDLDIISHIKTSMHAHVEPTQHVHHHASESHFFSTIFSIINLHWFLMLIVMMLPLLFLSIEEIFRKNFKRNRKISLALFFLGYAFVWTIVGSILSIFTNYLNGLFENQLIIAFVILTVLVIWQITPYKKISLNRCHFTANINPFGLQSSIDNLKFGIKKAWYCVGACWPFMWLCIAWMEPMMYIMPLFTLFLLVEQVKPKRRETWGFS